MKCLLNLEIMSAHDFDLDFLYVQVCTKCLADDDPDVEQAPHRWRAPRATLSLSLRVHVPP